MGGKTDVFENDLLKLIFQAVAIANLADNAAAAPLTNLYLSLHTADPTDAAASGQSTNETAYTGYLRKALVRTSSGWMVTGNSVSPIADQDFPTCTAAPGGAITHAGVGTASAGAGKLLYSGAVTPNITVAIGAIPRLTVTSTITED